MGLVKRSFSTKAGKHTEFGAVVNVGNPVTAQRLSSYHNRDIKVGDSVDLGMIAVMDSNPFKNWWYNFKLAFKETGLSNKAIKKADRKNKYEAVS